MNSKIGILLLAAYLLLTLLLTFSCSPAPQTPEGIVRAYIDAHNRKDIDRAMSFLSGDIQFEMGSGWVSYGRDRIRGLLEWDTAVAGTFTINHLEARGDTVHCGLTEQNDWFDLLGIDSIYYDSAQFYLREGSIYAFRSIIDNKSSLMIQNAFISMRNWAKSERPEALETLMPQGDFIYRAALAKPWMELLREWRAAAGQE